ncbi:hypothetical protein J7T55_008845 [Diaporthe amygdali]|uniref:uncharacterized protein n=1 Tax=Phomopsis amygdali TaxID=1214568 RepID=UPI0022FEAB84|nr:uncharacterized protein J7T55_008845 [Diaporthe amygdali]KAJ0121678.1 hypothetical protein J7T55_008845 [Diaporthe amygdali]
MHIQIWHQPQPDERRSRQMPPVSKKTSARPTTDNTTRQQQPQQQQKHHHQQQQHQHVVPSPLKPQFHSRKCHHTYNATRHLPKAVWIRAIRLSKENPSTVLYEIVLCYEHNRACTINRSWEDFQKLKSGLGSWRNAPTFCSPKDIDGLQNYLCEAINKKGREVAMEFFLRRRMDDCGGP